MKQLFLLFFAISISASYASELGDRWQSEINNPDPVASAKWLEFFASRHAVFVRGIFSELLPKSYMEDNASAASCQLGFGAVSNILPPSENEVEKNADYLAEELQKLYYQNNERPIVAVGHSKGGVELLLMLLLHPELLSMVEKVVLVQAPVKGSPVADLILKICRPLLSPCHPLYSWAQNGGSSLKPEITEKIFQEAFGSMTSPLRFKIGKRIFFVRSVKDAVHVSAELSVTRAWLSRTAGPNDGMVLTRDAYFPDFGIDLGVINADHGDLVMLLPSKSFWARTKKIEREAFTRAVMYQIYK